MNTKSVGLRSRREQVNLVLQADSSLACRLRDAEKETGQSRTQIVREVVEVFLDTWKQAELVKRRMLAVQSAPTIPLTLPVTHLTPRVRRGYAPEPGLAEAVAARRPIPDRVIGPPVEVQVGEIVQLKPRARPVVAQTGLDDDE